MDIDAITKEGRSIVTKKKRTLRKPIDDSDSEE
jgi:hypothetical protein